MASALDQLIAVHDATHREFALSVARGDRQGMESATRDLNNIGEQLDQAARATMGAAESELSKIQSMQPELKQKMRELGAKAAALGRISRERVDNSTRTAELETASEVSRHDVSVSQAAFIIFVTIALALITGYHRSVAALGVLALIVVYKPFSAPIRWQSLLSTL
jgi:hypothetical protein